MTRSTTLFTLVLVSAACRPGATTTTESATTTAMTGSTSASSATSSPTSSITSSTSSSITSSTSTSTETTIASAGEVTGATTSATTGDPAGFCGDGQLDDGEACDDGNTDDLDACDNQCQPTIPGVCGDGVRGPGERCDDGNDEDDDYCHNDCTRAIVQFSVGSGTVCAVLDTGALRCWGDNEFGQLGIDSTENIGDEPGEMPPSDTKLGGPVTQVSVADSSHVCALLADGTIRCWGNNASGRLGYGNSPDLSCASCDEDPGCCLGDEAGELPLPKVDVGGPATQVEAFESGACAVLEDGAVRCWGGGFYLGYAEEGNPTIGDDEPPSAFAPLDLGGPATKITAARDVRCALRQDQRALCWGYDAFVVLGYENLDPIGSSESPGEVGAIDVGGDILDITTNSVATCAIMQGGATRCWGADGYLVPEGLLGLGGDKLCSLPFWCGECCIGGKRGDMPPPDVDVGGVATRLAGDAGRNTMCAVLVGGALRCWGNNTMGILGHVPSEPTDYNIGDDETPAAVGDADIGERVIEVSTEGLLTCALVDSGALRCWGQGFYGAHGQGHTDDIGDDPGELPPPVVSLL